MAVAEALMVGKAVFDMASTYAKTKAAAKAGEIRAAGDHLRATTVIDDLSLAREELGMAGNALTAAERAAAAQVQENAARFGKLSLDRGMIDLEAEQQEATLRRNLGITNGNDIAMAAAMGIDPTASQSFVTLAAEQRRQAGEMIQNIRLNRMSADAANTAEEVGAWGRQAGLIGQQASFAAERGSQARTLLQIGGAERNSRYAQFVASSTGQSYADMGKNAWIGAVGSFMGSVIGSPAGQQAIGDIGAWAGRQYDAAFPTTPANWPKLGVPPT
jgi:hypothetical protein